MLPIKKDPVKNRMYNRRDENMGTPEQRLGDALQSGGKDVNDLMDLLSAMNSQRREGPSLFSLYNMTPEERERDEREYYDRSPSRGRSYMSGNGMTMYQPESENEGEYLGSGRLPTVSDVESILGRGAASSSQMRNVSKLFRDPAVMQYFMDIYGEAGRSYRPNTANLKYGGNRGTERSTGSQGVNHLWCGMDKSDRGENCP